MFICIAYVHFDRTARDRRAIRSGSAAYVVHVRWGGRVDFEVEAALPAATVRRVGTAEAKGRRLESTAVAAARQARLPSGRQRRYR
jgi:hypothetical protein